MTNFISFNHSHYHSLISPGNQLWNKTFHAGSIEGSTLRNKTYREVREAGLVGLENWPEDQLRREASAKPTESSGLEMALRVLPRLRQQGEATATLSHWSKLHLGGDISIVPAATWAQRRAQLWDVRSQHFWPMGNNWLNPQRTIIGQ